MIVHFNGMPGVGKLTIAKIVAEQLGAELIDNHSMIDIVTRKYAQGSPSYILELKKMREQMFTRIASEPADKIYLFTNSLASEMPEDRHILEEFAGFADRNKHRFIQVLLTCDVEENRARVVEEDRKIREGKLRNPDKLWELYEDYTMYHPPRTHALAIDTTSQPADISAEAIVSYIKKSG